MRVSRSPWMDALEKEMATHSSVLAWRILWTEEPGGLQSMGWQRVRQASLSITNSWSLLKLMSIESDIKSVMPSNHLIQGVVAACEQEGLEELSHVEGQEGWR